MNLFAATLCFALIAGAVANAGYNYNQPKPVAKQTLRPQASGSNTGIYSVQQAPPLPLFNIQAQQQALPQPQKIRPNVIVAPAPAPVPQYAAQPIEIPTPSPHYVQQQQVLVNQPAPQLPAQVPQYIAPAQQQVVYAPTFAAQASSSAPVQYNQQSQQQTIISKDIYIHSAPEETEEINSIQSDELGPIRKNYRIVFIKAPTQNIRFSVQSLKRVQEANEEKTVIYVLSKKPDITNIQNQLTTIQAEPKTHKPEVYFIKYRTPEEASRAQQEIQAQYDALGGSTRVSDEGIAPVTSVIGGAVGTGTLGVGALNGDVLGSVSLGGGALGGGTLGGGSVVNGVESGSIGSSSVNVGVAVRPGDLSVGSGSANGISQSGSSNFVQSQFQGSQASASSTSFAVQTPGLKYLPVKKK